MTDTSTRTAVPARPLIITVLAAMGILQGVISVLLGIFVVAERNDADFLRQINSSSEVGDHHITSGTLLTFGVIAIAMGALVILLAMSLARGSNIVRWAFVVLSALNAAGGLYAVVEYEGSQRIDRSVHARLQSAHPVDPPRRQACRGLLRA